MNDLLETVSATIKSGEIDRDQFITALKRSSPKKHGRKKLADPKANVMFRIPLSIKSALKAEAKEKKTTVSVLLRERLNFKL